MNTTRALALPVIAVMAATLLAGCGNTKGTTTPTSTAPSGMMSEEPAMMSDEPSPSEDAMMTEDAMESEDAMMSEDADG